MNKHKWICSHFLFATPSFWSGLARVLDTAGSYDRYNVSRTPAEADLRARVCDWLIIQRDLDAAWGRLLDQDPEYLDQLVKAIKSDPHLERKVLGIAAKEKTDEFEMAPQGA